MAPARMVSARSAFRPRNWRRSRSGAASSHSRDLGDVGLTQSQPLPVPTAPPMLGEVHPGEGADGAAEADHHVAAPGGGERRLELAADLDRSARSSRGSGGSSRRKPRVMRTAPSGALDVAVIWPAPDGGELEAAAAEIGDHAVELRQVLEGRRGSQAGLLGAAQDPHLDSVLAAERPEEPLAIVGVADGGRGDRDDPGGPASSDFAA